MPWVLALGCHCTTKHSHPAAPPKALNWCTDLKATKPQIRSGSQESHVWPPWFSECLCRKVAGGVAFLECARGKVFTRNATVFKLLLEVPTSNITESLEDQSLYLVVPPMSDAAALNRAAP